MTSMPISASLSIAIIEDNRLVRDTLAARLQRPPFGNVVALSFAEPASLAKTRPDVILLDAGLRDQDSLHVAAVLAKEVPTARIVVMDLVPVQDEIAKFVQVGVAGFIPKDATVDDFARVIRAVADGDLALPALSPESLFTEVASETPASVSKNAPQDVHFTTRERDVIALIGDGFSDRDAAHQLDIPVHAVRSDLRNIIDKLALYMHLQIVGGSRR
jgi:DNA-binding NarL/FixJ family response regulator